MTAKVHVRRQDQLLKASTEGGVEDRWFNRTYVCA